MIITTLNVIKTELIKGAKKDFKDSINKCPQFMHAPILGIYDCILKKNNINEETVNIWFAGSLFGNKDNTKLNFIEMLDNRAKFLINGSIVKKINISNNDFIGKDTYNSKPEIIDFKPEMINYQPEKLYFK